MSVGWMDGWMDTTEVDSIPRIARTWMAAGGKQCLGRKHTAYGVTHHVDRRKGNWSQALNTHTHIVPFIHLGTPPKPHCVK